MKKIFLYEDIIIWRRSYMKTLLYEVYDTWKIGRTWNICYSYGRYGIYVIVMDELMNLIRILDWKNGIVVCMGKSWTLKIIFLFLLYLLYFLHYFLKVWIKNIAFIRWIQRSWTYVNSVKATLIKVWSLLYFFLLATDRSHIKIYKLTIYFRHDAVVCKVRHWIHTF